MAALLVQCLFGSAVAARMWVEANGPLPLAQGHCAGHPAEQGAPGNPDQGPGHSTHDHEHCLLCNVAAGTCPLPIVALLSAPADEAVVLAEAPAVEASRKAVYANAPRGPPRLA